VLAIGRLQEGLELKSRLQMQHLRPITAFDAAASLSVVAAQIDTLKDRQWLVRCPTVHPSDEAFEAHLRPTAI
jgi:hypothetical protein